MNIIIISRNALNTQRRFWLSVVSLCVIGFLSIVIASDVRAQNVVAPIASEERYNIKMIVVKGNENIDEETVIGLGLIDKKKLGNSEGITVSELNDAVQRIRESNLFQEVVVGVRKNILIINVVEYPIINAISIEGNKRLEDKDLLKILKSKVSRAYSPSLAEADAAALADFYRARGRINAAITPQIIRRANSRVDLVFEVAEGKVTEIERISFVGNRAFSDRRLRQVLKTKQAGLLRLFIQSDTFLAERLSEDIAALRDFYSARGYIDFEVEDASAEISRERDAAFLTFILHEGQQYRLGDIRISSDIKGLDISELARIQRLKSGQVYSEKAIEREVIRVENKLGETGFDFVAVDVRETRNLETAELDIDFAIVPSEKVFIGRINISGNTATLDSVVRRQFHIVEGDPYNPREIRDAEDRINNLGFFENVEVLTVPGSSFEEVNIDVFVEEIPTGSISVGASYGLDAGVAATFGISEQNFLGRGQLLSFQLSIGINNSNSRFNFTEPAFLGRDLAFSFSLFQFRTNHQSASFDTSNIGGSIGLEFPLGDASRLDIHYALSRVDMSNYFGVDIDGNPDTPPVLSPLIAAEVARGAEISSAPGYTYSYDTRIAGVDPDRGFLFSISQDIAGLGGDTRYIKSEIYTLAEQNFPTREITLRTILEGGAIVTYGGYRTRIVDRFQADDRIRGFELNGYGPRDSLVSGGVGTGDALGGNYYVAAHFEVDFPLGLPSEYGVTGGAFWDMGSIWGLKPHGTIDDRFHLRSSIGVSVFWDAPIGPLRLNFAKAILKESYDKPRFFDLTVATDF